MSFPWLLGRIHLKHHRIRVSMSLAPVISKEGDGEHNFKGDKIAPFFKLTGTVLSICVSYFFLNNIFPKVLIELQHTTNTQYG